MMKRVLAGLAILTCLESGVARSEEGAAAPAVAAAQPAAGAVPEDYCGSFVDAAAELRNATQKRDLELIKTEIDEKLRQVQLKTDELQKWIAVRKEMQSKANDTLVKILDKVEPEAAAEQLAGVDVGTAAALLARLSAKKSGEILTLMDSRMAAQLVALMSRDLKDLGGNSL